MGNVFFWVGLLGFGVQSVAWGMGPKAPAHLLCVNPYERPTLSELKLDILFVPRANRYELTGDVLFPDGHRQTITSSASGNIAKRELSLEIPDTGKILLKLEMLEQGGASLIGAVSLFGKTEELFVCQLGPHVRP